MIEFPPSIKRNNDSGLWSYLVLERLGNTLGYMQKKTDRMTRSVILSIGIQIIDMLEAVHGCGYVYNDIKPTNLIVGKLYQSNDEPSKLKMIDFGLATKFLDKNGNHKVQQYENRDPGNQFFSSHDQMKLLTPSRKDDFISLCYLLVYLLDKDFLFLHEIWNKATYIDILKRKEKLTASDVCISSKSKELLDFVSAVFDLEFSEKPDYGKLKFLLIKELL